MKKNRKRAEENLNFWQPASDMFSALLLILMLVVLLLGLYLVHIPEHTQIDPWAGDSVDGSSDDGPDNTATPSVTQFFWMAGGGDGGGGETPHPTGNAVPTTTPSPTVTLSPTPTVSPTPDLEGGGATGGGGGQGGGDGAGEGPGDEPDMGLKSAVYVMVVDAETDRTIKQPLVEFELYGVNHALQILNTYYPERITFRTYETTENGTFYFPEKLVLGVYELHEMTEPEGYDASENIEFVLDETYDWSEPFVVRVPLYPSRNVIRVQMQDEETGLPVSGGTFDVVAAENIITADGTLRYRAGQVASVIECGEDGFGVSEELYLGNYLLRQHDIPLYYAGITEDIEVKVEKKSNVLPPVNIIASQRTRVTLSLMDELYPTRGIPGAKFQIIGGASTLEGITDSNGLLIVDTLQKGVTYRFRQVSAPDHYQISTRDYPVVISADGRIDGETEAFIEATNYMIRVNIGITDEMSSVQVPGIQLALYAQDGTLIKAWTSAGYALSFTDLTAGSYYLIKDGDTGSHYDFRVADQAELQNVNIHTTYILRYVAIGAAAAIPVLALAIFLVIRKKRKNKS